MSDFFKFKVPGKHLTANRTVDLQNLYFWHRA